MMTKQTPHLKPPTHKQRRTATKEPPRNSLQENCVCASVRARVCVYASWCGSVRRWLIPVLIVLNMALNSAATLNCKYKFGPQRGPLPHM